MIAEFGFYALLSAMGLLLFNSVNVGHVVLREQRLISAAVFACVCMSASMLVYGFVTNDFSIAYVSRLSSTQLPNVYRYTAVWGCVIHGTFTVLVC